MTFNSVLLTALEMLLLLSSAMNTPSLVMRRKPDRLGQANSIFVAGQR